MTLKKFKFKKVNSTNDLAIRLIRNKKCTKGIIISEYQKKGRGQHGNKWISLKGNLFATVFFDLENVNLSIKKLSIINANLVIKLLSKYSNGNFKLKFPNDILANKKKICGILQEVIEVNKIKYMIVGIGLNLIKKPDIKKYPTTSLFDLTRKKFDIYKIFNSLKEIYDIFLMDINSVKFNNNLKLSKKYIIHS